MMVPNPPFSLPTIRDHLFPHGIEDFGAGWYRVWLTYDQSLIQGWRVMIADYVLEMPEVEEGEHTFSTYVRHSSKPEMYMWGTQLESR